MSWLPDPHDLAQLPTVQQQPEEEPEQAPEELRQEIFQLHNPRPRPYQMRYQAADYRQSNALEAAQDVHGFAPADICRFIDGDHVPGRHCPHFELEDETGFAVNPSWTAQW